jgi:hypothetical protein
MADELYGGNLTDYADSMAEEMEIALNQVRGEAGLDSLPSGDTDRQMLFIAIARGVINHLQKKKNAFEIQVNGPLPETVYPEIKVKS